MSTRSRIARAARLSTAAPRSDDLGVPVVITTCLTASSRTAASATSASSAGDFSAIVCLAASD
jgi:hypothetical protein